LGDGMILGVKFESDGVADASSNVGGAIAEFAVGSDRDFMVNGDGSRGRRRCSIVACVGGGVDRSAIRHSCGRADPVRRRRRSISRR